MPLSIDMTATQLAEDGTSGEIMEILAFAMMFVGVPRLTESNLGEFEKRVRIYVDAFGEFWVGATLDDFVARFPKCVGTHANVSPLTAAQFRKRILDRKWREMEIAAVHAMKKEVAV